jgi:hypothetical protein
MGRSDFLTDRMAKHERIADFEALTIYLATKLDEHSGPSS